MAVPQALTCALCGKPIACDEVAVRVDDGVAHIRCAERRKSEARPRT